MLCSEILLKSQGNRVSLSLTIVFHPPSSAGLDPETRRTMWGLIHKAKEGRAIVLVTHSMEEADALCTRIAIMARGTLRVIGSNLHLKKKFGSGYKLEMVVKEGCHDSAHAFVTAMQPKARGVEIPQTCLRRAVVDARIPSFHTIPDVSVPKSSINPP